VTIDQRVRTTQPSAGSRRALRTVFRLWPMSVFAYLALTSARLAAQTPTLPSVEDADLQKWDELDVLTRLNANLDVTWIAQVRFSSELPNPVIYVVGTDWNVSIGKLLVITPSYLSLFIWDEMFYFSPSMPGPGTARQWAGERRLEARPTLHFSTFDLRQVQHCPMSRSS
jgi:hypothetical protein